MLTSRVSLLALGTKLNNQLNFGYYVIHCDSANIVPTLLNCL